MGTLPNARITRRTLFKMSAGAALATGVAREGAPQARARTVRAATRGNASKPNILFLMSDQHRGDCMGADGNAMVDTPHMDRLAREGARFRCAYSSTPTCTPARAAILTGQSPWTHGMLGLGPVGHEYPFTMPGLLAEAGYHTVGIGKMHYAPQRNLHGFHRTILDESGREQSIDFRSDYRAWFASVAPNLDPDATGIGWNDYRAAAYVLPEELHPTTWTGDVACNFIETYNRPEPFFAKVSFARPHSPYDPPQRLMDRYQDAELPPAAAGAWADRYRERSDDSFNIWHGDMGPAQVRHSRQGYHGVVTQVDEQIGRILESLEQRGMLDNTLILYTSDHGDMTGDHHLWRKSYAYEASARIPMLLRWPEGMLAGPRGQVIEQPVEIRDLLPTFLDAAGTEPPEAVEGRSMLELARGETGQWREFIDLEHDVCYHQRNHWSALTDGKTKYIFHAMDGEEQLFDLAADPDELQDLAGDTAHAGTLRAWRNKLIQTLEPRGDDWVKNGQLALRPEPLRFSPNYPGSA